MGNGTRILLNADGIITDWAKQHFEPVSSPLSAIANPKVAFDLLTPVDNSRHGFSVQQGVQKLKQYGRSEEHTSELQSHSEISYAVFCLKKIFFNDTATTEIYTNLNTLSLPTLFRSGR